MASEQLIALLEKPSESLSVVVKTWLNPKAT